MSNINDQLIAELRTVLSNQQYSPTVIGNYCSYAREFLDYLLSRNIAVTNVSEAHVTEYLRDAITLFQKRHGRSPGPYWHSIPRSGIHALLRLAQDEWPPAPKATCAADALRFAICDEYTTWLREERGLAKASIDALMWNGSFHLSPFLSDGKLASRLDRESGMNRSLPGMPDVVGFNSSYISKFVQDYCSHKAALRLVAKFSCIDRFRNCSILFAICSKSVSFGGYTSASRV